MGLVKTYNPKLVALVLFGQPITGFADGTMIEVERNSDSFTLQTGADGESARTANADKTGTIKITLMQTSKSNDILSAQLALDEATNLGTGTAMCRDLGGTTQVSSPECWVRKPANPGFAKENGNREWTIDCVDLFMFVGGNL